MPRLMSVAAICDNLAGLARSNGLKSLSMWLKLAANESYLNSLMTETRMDDRIGIFDWDVGNNLDYLNDVAGSFFGKDSRFAAAGAPVETYMSLIHDDDRTLFQHELARSIEAGGAFFAEYRVSAGNRERWLRADGNCSLDGSGRPMRLLGSLVDITSERQGRPSVAFQMM